MSNCEVSVVMSVYNCADYLERTLESVLSQEGCDLEFIVVDDGSTDASGQILDDWALRDKRLRIIHQQNAGLTRSLIRGCEAARGEFIARQDAGDISLPGRLKAQVAALRGEEALSFLSCVTHFIGPAGEFLYESAGSGQARSPTDIIDVRQRHGVLDGPSHHGSVMFRRDKYIEAGGYRQQFYYGQDWDLWYRMGVTGMFMMLPSTLYQARIGIGGISNNSKALQDVLATLSLSALKIRALGQSDKEVLDQADKIRPTGIRVATRGASARDAYFLGECLRRNGDMPRARSFLWKSILYKPLNFKAWARLVQTLAIAEKKDQ